MRRGQTVAEGETVNDRQRGKPVIDGKSSVWQHLAGPQLELWYTSI